MVEIDKKPRKMYEILSKVPIIELQNVTPEEIAEITQKAEQEKTVRQRLQKSLQKPLSEVLPETQAKQTPE